MRIHAGKAARAGAGADAGQSLRETTITLLRRGVFFFWGVFARISSSKFVGRFDGGAGPVLTGTGRRRSPVRGAQVAGTGDDLPRGGAGCGNSNNLPRGGAGCGNGDDLPRGGARFFAALRMTGAALGMTWAGRPDGRPYGWRLRRHGRMPCAPTQAGLPLQPAEARQAC